MSHLNAFINKKLKKRLEVDKTLSKAILTIKSKALIITDKLVLYIVIATIIGARLGHLIFYEDPSYYLKNPINILKLREGGLASHGGAFAILIALIFFCRYLRRYHPKISYVHLLDFIAAPTAFAGFCIRVGNFFNQEILGASTTMFWGVIFGHPQDGGPIVARHPMQLYEGFFYLLVFFFLFYLSYKLFFLKREGKLIGLFLILVFAFRFFIEFLKVKQSVLIDDKSFLLMGQILSIPFVILGIVFLFWEKIKSFFLQER